MFNQNYMVIHLTNKEKAFIYSFVKFIWLPISHKVTLGGIQLNLLLKHTQNQLKTNSNNRSKQNHKWGNIMHNTTNTWIPYPQEFSRPVEKKNMF